MGETELVTLGGGEGDAETAGAGSDMSRLVWLVTGAFAGITGGFLPGIAAARLIMAGRLFVSGPASSGQWPVWSGRQPVLWNIVQLRRLGRGMETGGGTCVSSEPDLRGSFLTYVGCS